jgi:predicted RNA-binding Zn ribbon-like protein
MMCVMSASTTAVRFRRGAGRLCLDYIRTLRHRGTADASEELVDPAALSAWVAQCGPCEVDSRELSGDVPVSDARRLREAIHELVQAGRSPAGAASCGARARNRINRAAALPVPRPRLQASGQVRYQADDPVSATLSLVARDAIDLATSSVMSRVRECADPRCGALFLDNSRPGTRRWCSMDVCGNRAKKNTLRGKVLRPAHERD